MLFLLLACDGLESEHGYTVGYTSGEVRIHETMPCIDDLMYITAVPSPAVLSVRFCQGDVCDYAEASALGSDRGVLTVRCPAEYVDAAGRAHVAFLDLE